MTLEQFWETIDQARGVRPGEKGQTVPSASPSKLLAILKDTPVDDVKSFMSLYYEQLIKLNHWNVWGAGYVIAGGMSDDGFHYFRSWLIGKGQAAVELALTDPDGLAPWIDDPEVDNELLEYVALEVLEAKGIEDDPRDDYEVSSDDEPEGKPFDEDAVFGQFRNLSARFG